MHIHTYKWRVHGSEPYSGIQGRHKCLWTLMDPDMYMHHVDIFPLLFLIFSFLITSQKDFIIPYIIDNRGTDSPHYHSIMYYFTPPIFSCLVNILLLFIRTISPYFTCINWVDTTLYSTSIWVLCSLSQQLFKSWNRLHCSLQAFGYYCQRLPGLTTKSIYCTKDTASNAVLTFCATWPFDTQSSQCNCQQAPKFPWLCDSRALITNWMPHTGSNLE